MSYFPFACMCILVLKRLFQCANLPILFIPISLSGNRIVYYIYIYVLIYIYFFFSFSKTSSQEMCFEIDWLVIKSQYTSFFYHDCSVTQVLFSIHYFFYPSTLKLTMLQYYNKRYFLYETK